MDIDAHSLRNFAVMEYPLWLIIAQLLYMLRMEVVVVVLRSDRGEMVGGRRGGEGVVHMLDFGHITVLIVLWGDGRSKATVLYDSTIVSLLRSLGAEVGIGGGFLLLEAGSNRWGWWRS